MFKRIIAGGVLTGALLFAGCGKAEEALSQLEALKKEACACKDVDCSSAAQTKFEEWAKKHVDTRSSQGQQEKAGKLAGEISECLSKVMAGDVPAEDDK